MAEKAGHFAISAGPRTHRGRGLDAPRRHKTQQIRGCGRSGRSRPEKQFSRIVYAERVDTKCVRCVQPLILLGNSL
jgi:hypothetical protein